MYLRETEPSETNLCKEQVDIAIKPRVLHVTTKLSKEQVDIPIKPQSITLNNQIVKSH